MLSVNLMHNIFLLFVEVLNLGNNIALALNETKISLFCNITQS